jgi:predicted ATP-dependent endonuclease of OLD family
MITISKLAVTNFKSLYDTNIDTLGQTDLFYGFNNSGKSNIFKFLELVFKKKSLNQNVQYTEETTTGRVSAITNTLVTQTSFYEGKIIDSPFLFWKNERSKPITFDIELMVSNDLLPEIDKLKAEGYLGEVNTVISLGGVINADDVSESTFAITKGAMNGKLFFELNDGKPSFFDGSKDLKRREGTLILALFDDLVAYIDTDRNFTKEFIKDGVTVFDSKNFKNWLFELNINSDKFEIFNQLISFLGGFEFGEDAKKKLVGNLKSFPFNSDTEISFSRFGNEVEVMLKNENGRFPLKNYGTGVQQFFFILASIFGSKSRIIIIFC